MNKFDKIKDLADKIDDLKSQTEDLEGELYGIAKPLFQEQTRIANKIIKEDEFKSLDTWYGSPKRMLDCAGQYGEFVYRDGELLFCPDDHDYVNTKLLPIFFDGTDEEKEEAVREFYRAVLLEREQWNLKQEQAEVEKAKEILRKAGVEI